MSTWEVIYQYGEGVPETATIVIRPLANSRGKFTVQIGLTVRQIIGLAILALSLGGMVGPFIPTLRLETAYAVSQAAGYLHAKETYAKPLPKSAPVIFNPLVAPDGSAITPVNRDFAIIVPKIGINAPIIAGVNPAKASEYDAALLKGVAQASTSMLPDQDGTVYLFSHSTNYDWFVKDLNAVFYLLKNLKEGDLIVLVYKGTTYTYRLRDSRVVAPSEVSYLVPQVGKKNLILQTCWPPGSINQRLLLFADFVEQENSKY